MQGRPSCRLVGGRPGYGKLKESGSGLGKDGDKMLGCFRTMRRRWGEGVVPVWTYSVGMVRAEERGGMSNVLEPREDTRNPVPAGECSISPIWGKAAGRTVSA